MENLSNNLVTASVANVGELYNLSLLEEMEDNEYLVEVLDIFLKEAPVELKEMTGALQSRKIDVIGLKAHKLKNSVCIIQASQLTECLTRIEMLGKEGIIKDELISLVENAVQQYNSIEQALKKHIKELK